MLTIAQRDRLVDLIEAAFREVGVLLLAFTPLDAVAWRGSPDQDVLMLRFMAMGFLLLGMGTAAAVWRFDARH